MRNHTPSLRNRFGAAVIAIGLVAATACSGPTDSTDSTDAAAVAGEPAAIVALGDDAAQTASSSSSDTAGSAASDAALFDSDVVHDIAIEFDQDAYDAMIATYETTGEKDWIESTVTIDGTIFENVGLRLKGNSSLFGLTSSTAGSPEELPWLIRLDKFVDDQTYQGIADLVVRSNSTETAMNEAVALELLEFAGLASQQAIATTLTVNGGDAELRLVVEHPDEIWEESNFDADESALYKADSEGDYSYRGDDPEAYEDVFDQKAGDDDLDPLIDFLDFINNSDDATFATELADRLDVEAFATYLAFQDLVDNFDDIDGPGNNSYLHYDYDEGVFTVVNWDLNLAFGTANVNGGGPGAGGPGGGGGGQRPERPEGVEPPEGFEPGAEGGGARPDVGAGAGGFDGAGARGGNVLAERFLADVDFAAMYTAATETLTETLYGSGAAADIVDRWVSVLDAQAFDIVDAAAIDADAAAILARIEGI